MRNFEAESIIEKIRLDKNNPHLSVLYFLRLMKFNIIVIICGLFYAIIQSNHSPAGNLPAGESFLSQRLCGEIVSFAFFLLSFLFEIRNTQSDIRIFIVFSQCLVPSAQRLKNHVHQILPCLKSRSLLLESNLCASAMKKFHLIRSDFCSIDTSRNITECCNAQT